MLAFFDNLLDIYLETAIWLLLGLGLAALIKGWIPDTLVRRLLSGNGPGAVVRAALIGAPLPLCSCGVLPTAVGLRRSGASKPATTAFLIATPETGIDSISVTYALMGPVMAVIRPVSAVISAIVSGLLVMLFDTRKDSQTTEAPAASASGCSSTSPAPTSSCCESKPAPATTSCCDDKPAEPTDSCCSKQSEAPAASGCCASDSCSTEPPAPSGIWQGLRFALVDILDDIKYWMAFGLVLAAIIASLVEPGNLAEYGSGLSAMLLMLVVGLPLYICASASTPLAAALLYAGMSPGAVLVFLLVGPATNIASIGILVREMGKTAVALYLAGISLSAITLGLLVDNLLGANAYVLAEGFTSHNHTEGYSWLHWVAAVLLLLLCITPLRRRMGF
jgi:uncharacterized membrane protein YraQ (UPF0718 family)